VELELHVKRIDFPHHQLKGSGAICERDELEVVIVIGQGETVAADYPPDLAQPLTDFLPIGGRAACVGINRWTYDESRPQGVRLADDGREVAEKPLVPSMQRRHVTPGAT